MSKTLFLFDGGNYKRGIDDGRSRVPLTPQEAELVFYDPEVPGDAGSSIGTEFNMKKWAQHLCNLTTGDELFIGLVPDAAFYRGLFMMSFDVAPGFTANLDLVSVADVYAAYLAGDASNVAAFNTGPDQLSYDFADGLGNATKDADLLADLYGGFGDTVDDYRNNDAAVAEPWAVTKFAPLGEALYFRLTITAITANLTGTGCCGTCGDTNMPTFQVGAVYDRLCIDKQRVRKYCNCPVDLCGTECPDAPPLTVVLAATGTTGEFTATFSEIVSGFADFADWKLEMFVSVPAGLVFDTIVDNTAGGDFTTYTVTVVAGGGHVATDLLDVNIPVDLFTSVSSGELNLISNVLEVEVPA